MPEFSRGTGSPNGAQLAYNNEGELAAWQNAPSTPGTTAAFLYDGLGQRMAQPVTQGGTTSTTVYVGDVEEVATSGSTTTTTTYYYANGKRIALGVNGQISYLASDALGSATVAFGSNGTATASQLFTPYGSVRYSSGTMPTSFGFTGQRADSVTGLDYYGARYFDPVAGLFTSADTVLPGNGLDILGLSRYAYIEGNPINRTDPSGHCFCDGPGTGDNFFPRSGGPLLTAPLANSSPVRATRRFTSYPDPTIIGRPHPGLGPSIVLGVETLSGAGRQQCHGRLSPRHPLG